MTTQLAIDDTLILEAQQLGHHATQSETVISALQEYVQHKKQLQIVDHFGTIEYDPDYDYKQARAQR